MSTATKDIHVAWNEDGSATVLGRLTARNGTGAATGIDGEGKFVKQSDLNAIDYNVYVADVDGTFTLVPGQTGALTISTVILDTPDASNEIWVQDSVGYNFIHDLPATSFPDPDVEYLAEYKFTFTGGEVAWVRYRGYARGVEVS